MKKYAFLFLLFAVVGCTHLDQATRDAILCQKDPVCYELAKDRSALAKDIGTRFNPLLGNALSAFVLAIGLWLGGREIRKKNG